MGIIHAVTLEEHTGNQNYIPKPKKTIVPTDTMKSDPFTIPLFGHGLETLGSINNEPTVKGVFATDVITGNDGKKYALFTVADEYPAFPSEWAGTYRINVDRLAAAGLDVFA